MKIEEILAERTAEEVALKGRIPEVLGSNIGRDNRSPDSTLPARKSRLQFALHRPLQLALDSAVADRVGAILHTQHYRLVCAAV